jgi:hypothetical protein
VRLRAALQREGADTLGATSLSQDFVQQRDYEFNSIMLSSINRIMQGVLGQGTTEIVFDHMEFFSGLKSEDVPTKIDLFRKLLEDLLGCGATIMEKMIVKDIYSRLDLQLVYGGDFISSVNNARTAYIQNPLSDIGNKLRG